MNEPEMQEQEIDETDVELTDDPAETDDEAMPVIALPKGPAVEDKPAGETMRVFAFRVTEAERTAILATAEAAGWKRGNGGVTGFVRALLAAACDTAK